MATADVPMAPRPHYRAGGCLTTVHTPLVHNKLINNDTTPPRSPCESPSGSPDASPQGSPRVERTSSGQPPVVVSVLAPTVPKLPVGALETVPIYSVAASSRASSDGVKAKPRPPQSEYVVHPRLNPELRSLSDGVLTGIIGRPPSIRTYAEPNSPIRRGTSTDNVPLVGSGSLISGRPPGVPRLRIELVPNAWDGMKREQRLEYLDAFLEVLSMMLDETMGAIRHVQSEPCLSTAAANADRFANDICPNRRWEAPPGALKFKYGHCDLCGEKCLIRATTVVPSVCVQPWVHRRRENKRWGPPETAKNPNHYYSSLPASARDVKPMYLLWCISCISHNVNPVWQVFEDGKPMFVPGLKLHHDTRCCAVGCNQRVAPQARPLDLWVVIKLDVDGHTLAPMYLHKNCRKYYHPMLTTYTIADPLGTVDDRLLQTFEKFCILGKRRNHGPLRLKPAPHSEGNGSTSPAD